ncbi:MAG TPA: cupin domain-containing protein [Candidatus Aquilonibacter sp.]|nr:cupin domain-containing protein [Candidatus Aquilonibacter sp.]
MSSSREDAVPIPDVGKIIERLRAQRGLSVKDLAEQSGLSASFIRAVERGDSDISLGRLARLAHVFHYDLGSFLGFTSKLSRPSFVTGTDRKRVNRGRGVTYEALHLPALDLDLVIIGLEGGASFKNDLSHEGIDVVYVTGGEIVLEVNGTDYPMATGECCVFSAAFPHRLRNDSKRPASAISVTTGRM